MVIDRAYANRKPDRRDLNMTALWAGIDAGKRAHHCVLIELLAAHAQQLLHIAGRIVHHAATTLAPDPVAIRVRLTAI